MKKKKVKLTGVLRSYDNILVLVELLPPSKTDALPYLNSRGKKPDRYARARIQFGTAKEPYIQEYLIGPLPVKKGTITLKPLNYPFNGKNGGRYRVYVAGDTTAAFTWLLTVVATDISDITQTLFRTVSASYLSEK